MINVHVSQKNKRLSTQIKLAKRFIKGANIVIDQDIDKSQPYIYLGWSTVPVCPIPLEKNIYYSNELVICVNPDETFYELSKPFFSRELTRKMFPSATQWYTFLRPGFVLTWNPGAMLKYYISYDSMKTNYMSYKYYAMVFRFAKEWLRWKAHGSKLRVDQDIDLLFAQCEQCPFFEKIGKKEGQCGICGCSLKDSSDKNMNKLAWDTTHCPANPPRWF